LGHKFWIYTNLVNSDKAFKTIETLF
jgi:hypothetical protein